MALTQTTTTNVNINSLPSDQPSTRLDNGLFQLLQKNIPTKPSSTNNQPIVSQLSPSSSPNNSSLTRLVVSKNAMVVSKTDNTLLLKSLPMTPSNDHGNTVVAIPISKPIPSPLYFLKIFSPPLAEPHPDDKPLQQAPLGISFVALWPQLNQLRNDGNKMNSNVERLIKSLFVGLQRIQGQQIDSLMSQRDGPTTSSHSHYWQMDLPLLLGDKFHSGQLHIYQKNDEAAQRKNGPSKQTGWGMRLNFELGEHGEMTVDAGLLGHQLQLSLWLSRPCTLQKAEQGISKLLEKFRHAGLHIEEITCHAGTPPAIKPSLQLLDTQT